MTLRRSKERSNREYKANLNERPYYAYSTESKESRKCSFRPGDRSVGNRFVRRELGGGGAARHRQSRVVEINKAPQDVFFSPTWEAEKAWGEPAVNFHNGMYTMIYDYFPTPLPFGLATSKDGVYWRDAGPVFEKDADAKDIECAYVHRFQPDGPWVMQYAFRKEKTAFRMRFAVSDDLIHWKKLGAESDFVPDPRWYTEGRWDTIVPCPKGDGTHYGAWDGVPKEGSGFGFGTTTDGIRWNVLPPVRLMVPQATPGCAGEIGGFFKIGDRYYISFSRMTLLSRDEFTAVSDRPEGPYHPTPKNHFRPEDPFIYARCYNLPGGIYSAEMLWMMRDGKRSYHFPLLKKVEREGESLWLKWWQGNEKLKSRPVALAAPAANKQVEGCRRFDVPETLDLSKGTVIEGTIRLPARSALRKNFALARHRHRDLDQEGCQSNHRRFRSEKRRGR